MVNTVRVKVVGCRERKLVLWFSGSFRLFYEVLCGFDVDGSEKLLSGGVGFSSDKVEVNAIAPENDNVKFAVTPKMGNGEKPNSFFFRVKMKRCVGRQVVGFEIRNHPSKLNPQKLTIGGFSRIFV